MKRLILGVIVMLVVSVGFTYAADEPIGIVVNSNTNCFQLIDPMAQEISGPYLKGLLGTYGGGLFDAVITPDGKTAIISNFGDSTLWFVDISGGFNGTPKILGSTPISFFAEDIEISTDGIYALVTDGGFAPGVAVVNIKTRTLVTTQQLDFGYANCVTATPDGKYILFGDYFTGAIYNYRLNANGTLTYVSVAYLGIWRPVNLAVTPDSKTLIPVCAGYSTLPYFLIDSQGNLCQKGVIPMPARNGQSCVINQAGTKAYYLSNSQNKGTMVVVLNITGPGKVSYSGMSISLSVPRGTSQLFGVDTIAMDPAGHYLYVTNPTLSGGLAEVSIIDLTTNTEVNMLSTIGIPTGIAFGTIAD